MALMSFTPYREKNRENLTREKITIILLLILVIFCPLQSNSKSPMRPPRFWYFFRASKGPKYL